VSLPHDSAHLHVTGRSEFVDDRPAMPGELQLDLVYSPHARARIVGLDVTAARAVPGVVEVFTAKDLANNLWGSIFHDQPLLAATDVHYVGEIIAIVAADTREAARAGRAQVRVAYEPMPALLDIDAAVRAHSFIGARRTIERGEVDRALPLSRCGAS